MINLKMTSLKIVGAAVLLSAAFATEAFAQAAVQEPGAFAFYHPNADVLNAGRGGPPAAGAFAYIPERGDVAGLRPLVRSHRARHAGVRAY
jgi:hypothetical protein